VPLAALTDPELVLPTLAATLGLREEGSQPLGERLRDVLAAKQVLLILDNVEHLVEAAPGVGELLGAAPDLKVLATSRVPLRLRAEREYAVPPLGLPRRKPPPPPEQLSQYEAVRLFIARAQAVRSDFTIDNETAPAVAEICWRLDGLPLAIELAAARIRMLPPAAMLSRLEHRLPMLTGGARDAPERQRTLRNTIAWSYDLLEPDDRTLFRRLAVFAGGATFEAIEAVVNPDGNLDVFGGVERLLEQSLLRQDEGLEGEPRFSMLETIREFGLEQLEAAGEGAEVRHRHAAFYLRLVERAEPELLGPGQPLWLDRLETEHDNVRAALGWALDMDVETALRLAAGLREFWFFRGHLSEGRAWFDRTLEVSGEPGPLHVGALHGAGMLAIHAGDYSRATALEETCLALARKFQDRRGEALALLELGIVASQQEGDSPRAIGLTESSLAVWRELDEAWGTALALNNLGYAAYRQGDFERAAALLDEALSLARIAGERVLLGSTLDSLGAVAEAKGELTRAAALYREALTLGQEIGNHDTVAMALRALASVAAKVHQSASAARLSGAALGLEEAIGAPLSPEEEERHEQMLITVRTQLGEETFATTWLAGKTSPIEEAVAEALALADEVTRDGIAERQ
jgi:predicted ATPase